MPTWCRCSPPILFWRWPPFNLLQSSCITWRFFSSILTDGYHFVCSTHQSICHFDKLSCIYFNGHMIYMYTYFVLTSINSCFVHVQQHAPPWIAGSGHPCSDRSLFYARSIYLFFFGNIEKCPFIYWLNGRWFLQIVDFGNFNMKLNGRWFPQIVDTVYVPIDAHCASADLRVRVYLKK